MVFKCKMCAGILNISEGSTICKCEYCGCTSTIPKTDDAERINLFERANDFRLHFEFDKATEIYEKLIVLDNTDAEAHWGAVISRFGVEYVEDPRTGKRIPTCHRVQSTSILSDLDYQAAVRNAPDGFARELYEEQAKEIADIQKNILIEVQKQDSYDVFICYKETDEYGRRTRDSVLAQEIYFGLTDKGYKVFFSRVTLEDKLGEQYEPCIFSALQSARVMLVVGTKPEYFNTVWVKNEWGRYLDLMKKDRKRMLIPCYRDMDPYQLPPELSHLQSQDMGRIGFLQDLLRGIEKVLDTKETKPKNPEAIKPDLPETPRTAKRMESGGTNPDGVNNLINQVYTFLQYEDYEQASRYLDIVLMQAPQYAPAYIAKVCAAFCLHSEKDLANTPFRYEDNEDWQNALFYATKEQAAVYSGYAAAVREKTTRQVDLYARDCAIEMAVNPGADRESLTAELAAYKESCYHSAQNRPDGSRRRGGQKNEEVFRKAVSENDPGHVTESGLKAAAEMFEALKDTENADCCRALAELARKKHIYQEAEETLITAKNAAALDGVAARFETVADYKDARERAAKCREQAEEIRAKKYHAAVTDMENVDSITSWDLIIRGLADADLAGYRDVARLLDRAEQMKAEWKKEALYQRARKAMNGADTSRKWLDAKDLLRDSRLSGYKDIEILRQKAIMKYTACVEAENEEQKRQDEIVRRQKKMTCSRRVKILGIIAACIALVLLITQVIVPNAKNNKAKDDEYQAARALMDAGNYTKAYVKLAGIRGYKDVDKLLTNDQNLSAAAAAAAHEAAIAPFKKVGSYVTFGSYEQDNNTGNGKEAIEWLVLDAQEDKALLISRYALDRKPYNTSYTSVTWETCSLRTWLNSTFINNAFTEEEQKAVLTTTVDNSKSQGDYDTNGGNNTQDKVFLLSYAEAWKYFKNDDDRMCAPTSYAEGQGAWTSSSFIVDGKAACYWWLRSPGSSSSSACLVNNYGARNHYDVSLTDIAVRPAFWLDLTSDIF